MRRAAALLVAVAIAAPLALATSYPNAAWSAAASCNYTSSNREATYNIDMVVIHTAQGSYSGTISWFKNCKAGASAHYVVSKTGAITAMVRDEDVAWQAGHWVTNTRSIGIEHEGFVSDPNAYTDAMYQASAALTRWLASRYNIPVDRSHIIGHNEVPGCSGSGGGASCHTDPGRYWDWSRYMALVRGGDGSAPSVPSVGEDHTGSAWSTHSSPRWHWSASDPETGIAKFEVETSWGGTFQTTAREYHPTLGTGAHSVRVRAQNGAGGWSGWSGWVTARVDVTPPNPPSVSENHAGTAWTMHNHPNFYWSNPGDTGSGVASYVVDVDGARSGIGGATSSHATLADGVRTFRAHAVDGVGLWSAASNAITVRVDATPPSTRLAAGAPLVRDGTPYYSGSTPLALLATDPHSGVAWSERAFNDGGLVRYAGPFLATGLADGEHALRMRSGDVAGNVEGERSQPFVLDTTPPALALGLADGSAVVSVGPTLVRADATDALAGVASVEFRVDGRTRLVDASAPYEFAWPAGDEAAGPHYVEAFAKDRVGNVARLRVNVTTVPTSQAGVEATLARLQGWTADPPPVGVYAGCTDACRAGAVVGDQFLGAVGPNPG